MKNTLRLLAISLAATALIAGCAKKDDKSATTPAASGTDASLQSDAQKFGYAIGVDLGKSLQPVKDDTELAALKAGLDDTFAERQRGVEVTRVSGLVKLGGDQIQKKKK